MSTESEANREEPKTELGEVMLRHRIDGLIWAQFFYKDEWHIKPFRTVSDSPDFGYDEGYLYDHREGLEGVFGFILDGEISFEAGSVVVPAFDERYDEDPDNVEPIVDCEVSRDELRLAVQFAGRLKHKKDWELDEFRQELVRLGSDHASRSE